MVDERDADGEARAEPQSTQQQKETRDCPFCGGPILLKALQCVHCKRWMPELNRPPRHQASGFEPVAYSRAQPTRHLILLTILTLGAYEFYWFYRNWRDLTEHLDLELKPGWRTAGLFVPFLNVFMVYDQIRLVAAIAAGVGIQVAFSPSLLTATFFALAFVSNITMVWVLSLLTVLPLLPVQQTLNIYWQTEEPDRPVRDRFTQSELLAMSIGFVFLLAALLSGTVPE